MTAHVIPISATDLGIAAALVCALALLTWRLHLALAGQILAAGLRTAVQLLLIALVLKALFAHVALVWVAGLASVMLLIAGREVMARQHRRLKGWWGFVAGTSAMFVSSFTVTVLALALIIQPEPWFTPRYAIPLLGMVLGNCMNGIAVGLDRLTQGAWQQRAAIEAQLMLGRDWREAMAALRRESTRAGMIPMINAMAAAGVVSLPGMMTGQILAGSSPLEAVKYQILVMFLITSGTGFGTVVAVWLAARRLFDERQRLRLERLRNSAV